MPDYLLSSVNTYDSVSKFFIENIDTLFDASGSYTGEQPIGKMYAQCVPFSLLGGGSSNVYNVTNNYTTVSSYSTVYNSYTTESYITNIYSNEYMKIWDFPDGPYQYNIMGGISNPIMPFESYLDILGAYNISALNLTGKFSKINLQGINMKSINITDTNNSPNINILANNVEDCTFSKIGNINIEASSISGITLTGGMMNEKAQIIQSIKGNGMNLNANNIQFEGNKFYSPNLLNINANSIQSNTFESGKAENINAIEIDNNSFKYGLLDAKVNAASSNTFNGVKAMDLKCQTMSENIINSGLVINNACSLLVSNSYNDCDNVNIAASVMAPNTFSNINKLHVEDVNRLDIGMSSTISFNSISKLFMNEYIPTSNKVEYNSVNKFILGNPENLFDISGNFTQSELNSLNVYLSEVPVNLLNKISTVNLDYMKSLDTTLRYQYNISGLWDSNNSPELRITNSEESAFPVYILGSNSICNVSIPATPYAHSTIPMRWNFTCDMFNSNSFTSSNQNVDIKAYELKYNSFNSLQRLKLNADDMLWNKFNTLQMGEITANTFSKNSFTSMFSLNINANNVLANTWDTNRYLNVSAYRFNSNLIPTGSFMTIEADTIKDNTFIQSEALLKADLISGNSMTKTFIDVISLTLNSVSFNCKSLFNNTISGWGLVDLFSVNSFGTNSGQSNKLYWNHTIRMQEFLTWFVEGEYSAIPFIPYNYLGDHGSIAPALNYDLRHMDLARDGIIENGKYKYTGPWYKLYSTNLPSWTSETINSLNISSNGVALSNMILPTTTYH